MASRILHQSFPHFRTPLIAAGLGVSAALCFPHLAQRLRIARPYLLDGPASGIRVPGGLSFPSYESEAQTPVVQKGRLNAGAIRQLSLGSVLGLLAGLGVSVFSKSLAVVLGLLVVGVQTAESYGIHLVPYKRIQRYVRGVDVRSALQDNVAFKVSFGLIFALTGFADFGSER